MSNMRLKLKPIDIEFSNWDSYKVKQMIDGKQGGGSREEVLMMLKRQVISEIEKNLPTMIEEIIESQPIFTVADTRGITRTTFSLVEPEFPKYHVGITHDIALKGNQSSPIYKPIEECSYCSPKQMPKQMPEEILECRHGVIDIGPTTRLQYLTPEEQGRIDMLDKEKDEYYRKIAERIEDAPIPYSCCGNTAYHHPQCPNSEYSKP